MKLRTRLRAIFIISLLFWAYPSITSLLIGSIFIIIGQIIHFISAGYLVKQEKLITNGPYRHVRNPFYVGSFLVDIGLCIVTQNIYVAVIYMPLFYLFVIPRRVRKEEEFLEKHFSDRYTEYCLLVPRFIPRLLPIPFSETNGHFDWGLILKYREQWRFFRIAGLIIYFYLYLKIISSNAGPSETFRQKLQTIIDTPADPLSRILALILIVILCLPPIWEFLIKPIWKYATKK
jgi:hypothetical protein